MEKRQGSFIIINPLIPVGPAEDLFIAGVSTFEITAFEPPLQRVTIVGINLPEPDVFGPFTDYLATLEVPTNGEVEELTRFTLEPTFNTSIWGGTTLLEYGGTLFPINVTVRPISQTRVGPVILEGPVFPESNGADNDNNGTNAKKKFSSSTNS